MHEHFKNKILTNTIATGLENFFCFAVPFILFPFIIRHLGVKLSGLWFLCSTITGYFGIFEQGPGPAVVKFIAQFHSQNDFESINKHVSCSFVVFLLFGFISMVIMFFFAFFGAMFIKLETLSSILFRNVFIIMGVTLLIAFPLKIFNSILKGFQEFRILAFFSVFSMSMRAVLTVMLLLNGKGIYTLLVINLVTLLIQYGIPIIIIKSKYPKVKMKISFIRKEDFTQVIQFGGATFLINLCAVVIFQSDRVLLGSFLSIAAVTYYSACKQIYDVCRFFPVLILQAIMPFASELHTLRKDEVTRKLLMLSTKYSYAIFVPLGVFVMFSARDILSIWVGQDYTQYAICLQILVFHLFFNFLHQAGTQILIGSNKIRFILVYFILALFLNISLSLLLVQKYRLLGVALGTSIPFVLLEWLFVKKMLAQLEVKTKLFLTVVLIPNLINLFSSVLLCLIAKMLIQPRNLLSLLGGFIVIYIVLFMSFLFFGVSSQERKSLLFVFGKGKNNPVFMKA